MKAEITTCFQFLGSIGTRIATFGDLQPYSSHLGFTYISVLDQWRGVVAIKGLRRAQVLTREATAA